MDTLELLDSRARLRLMLGLWPYVVPLVLVYWAESAAAACNPATPRPCSLRPRDPACCSLQPHVLGAATQCLQPATLRTGQSQPASLLAASLSLSLCPGMPSRQRTLTLTLTLTLTQVCHSGGRVDSLRVAAE